MLNLVLSNEQARRFDGIPNSIQKLSYAEEQQPDFCDEADKAHNQNQWREIKERNQKNDKYHRHFLAHSPETQAEKYRAHQHDKER